MAIRFNGSTDALTTGAIVTAAPFTVACWFLPFNVTGAAQDPWTIYNSGAANQYWTAGFNGAATAFSVFAAAGGAGAQASSAGPLRPGKWSHGSVVETSTTSRAVYLDGGQVGTNTTSRAPSGINGTGLGAFIVNTSSQFYNGLLADFAIWNVALTVGELAALAAGARPWEIRPSALVSALPGDRSLTLDRIGRVWGITGSPKLVPEMPPIFQRRSPFHALRHAPNSPITAAQGAYALTGNAALLKRGLRLTAAQGSFSLTGEAALFKRTLKMPAAQGAYTLTGQAAIGGKGRSVTADHGSFAITLERARWRRGYPAIRGRTVTISNQSEISED